ncbi:unnamed protein product, partial [Effrenium voratum]
LADPMIAQNEPPPWLDDLRHIKEHYVDMFHSMDILNVLPDQKAAVFRVVSRLPSRRELEVLLNDSCFEVQSDSQASLVGSKLESFEQLLSAMDGADAFGSRLCDLVSQQLAGLKDDSASP